ncbi:endoribonuclease YbeY [Rickettsiales bacterium]|nr:endoribonuclease YbeY [Rickettsiales bacterium]
MAAIVSVNVGFDLWCDLINNIDDFVDRVVMEVLSFLFMDNLKVEVSVLLTNDRFIRELNLRYRNINKATNVLAFRYVEDLDHLKNKHYPAQLGDVVLSAETIRSQSQELEVSFAEHAAYMLIHGTLHLLGHDHQKDEEAEIMEDIEEKILRAIVAKKLI